MESKLFSLNISLDGALAETHDLQRGVQGSHKAVLRGIDLMKIHSKRTGIPVPIVIKPTLTNLNYHEMPDLTRFVSELGVKGILFQPVSDWGTSEFSNLWIRDSGALQDVIHELVQLKRDGYPILNEEWQIRDWIRHFSGEPKPSDPHSDGILCWVGLTTLIIKTDGTLAFCHPLDSIGNVKDHSVRDIWYSDAAKSLRSKTIGCTMACGENCSIKRSLRQQIGGAIKLLNK